VTHAPGVLHFNAPTPEIHTPRPERTPHTPTCPLTISGANFGPDVGAGGVSLVPQIPISPYVCIISPSLSLHYLSLSLSLSSLPLIERGFFIDNLLVRIHWIIEMILVDRPCAMGV
jgi:hypothetical protein